MELHLIEAAYFRYMRIVCSALHCFLRLIKVSHSSRKVLAARLAAIQMQKQLMISRARSGGYAVIRQMCSRTTSLSLFILVLLASIIIHLGLDDKMVSRRIVLAKMSVKRRLSRRESRLISTDPVVSLRMLCIAATACQVIIR